jgi:hypothetical protein
MSMVAYYFCKIFLQIIFDFWILVPFAKNKNLCAKKSGGGEKNNF